jgi:hypothetical protein
MTGLCFMDSSERERFLVGIRGDRQLQDWLLDLRCLDVAVAVARAAGFEVHAAELLLDPAATAAPDTAHAGEAVDFDGDGVPDAVCREGRWVLTRGED